MDNNSPLHKKIKRNTAHADLAVPLQGSPDTAGAGHGREPLAKRDILAPSSSTAAEANITAAIDKPPLWFIQFFENFEKRQDARIESILDKKLHQLTSKLSEQDEKIKSLTFELTVLNDAVKSLEVQNGKLERKLDDLENRSRRNNLVVFGLKESNNEDCKKVIHDFLQFAEVPEEDIKNIQRCHRTPSFRSQSENVQRPRRIHIGFGSFTAKERARKCCIKMLKASKSLYQDQKAFVAEDLSQHVLQLRKAKAGAFKRLKEEGKSPFFVFPDKLCYKSPNGKLITT